MALLVAKVPFWEGAPKGVLLSVIPKSCVLLKTLFYSVFSKTQLCRPERAKQNKTKIRVVCQNGQRCFFWSFFGFWWFCFLGFSVFLCFCFVHNSPKWLFSCIFRVFLSILFPQKACLKLFIFFLFCFFCFCLPFQKSIFFFAFLSINPFLEKALCGVSFVFLLLAFSFPNVCLFVLKQTFLTSPFLTQVAFIIGSLCFSSVVLVFVFMVYVSAFLFLCWLCF